MSSPLPVIPRPPRHRWQDFRVEVLPAVVFLLVLGAAVFTWKFNWAPTLFVGEVESPASIVLAPEAGRLLEVQTQAFSYVTNGQVLARIARLSDDNLRASLAQIRADLGVMRARMLQDQERNDLNVIQLRTDFLLRRTELATARIQLRQAESEFERVERLHEAKLVPAGINAAGDTDGLDVALRDRDTLRSEVREREQIVEELGRALETLRPAGSTTNSVAGVQDAIEAAIAAQEEAVREASQPIVIRAAIDGMVMKGNRFAGETVTAGEILFEITGTRPQWILGFIRQPISEEPAIGSTIEVRSRGRPRQTGTATVTQVGAHLLTFSQPLRVRGFDPSLERGLPVLLTYPENLNLHPGELVDLVPR